MTDGDRVSFTVPWMPDSYAVEGTPDRSAIAGVAIRAPDDGRGERVRVHLNGLALVLEPVQKYPSGVVSFTFDDDWATAFDPGAKILEDFAALADHVAASGMPVETVSQVLAP